MFRNPTTDLLILLVIVLLFVGPKRLPGLGRGLGQGMREFKDSITGHSKDEEEEQRPEIARTSAPPVTGTAGASAPAPGATPPERESAEIGSDRTS